MPWNWQGRGDVSTDQGGTRGSIQEAKVAHAWPKYEAEYLAKRLKEGGGKYGSGPSGKAPDDVADYVYFEKISEDYKSEADECLKSEFGQWLAGQHPDNVKPATYKNKPGLPVRKAVFRDNGEIPGQPLNRDWKPTWWADRQLTHLPGVRDYLRDQKKHSVDADLRMNLLAETGPQDLEQAWIYFKHWVKGRPIAPEICMTLPGPPGEFGDGSMMPPGMKGWRASTGTPRDFGSGFARSAAAEDAASRDAMETGSSVPSAFAGMQAQLDEALSGISAMKEAKLAQEKEMSQLKAEQQRRQAGSAEYDGVRAQLRAYEISSARLEEALRAAELGRETDNAGMTETLTKLSSQNQGLADLVESLQAELNASVENVAYTQEQFAALQAASLSREAQLREDTEKSAAAARGTQHDLGATQTEVDRLRNQLGQQQSAAAEQQKALAVELARQQQLYEAANQEQRVAFDAQLEEAIRVQQSMVNDQLQGAKALHNDLLQSERAAMARELQDSLTAAMTNAALTYEAASVEYYNRLKTLAKADQDILKQEQLLNEDFTEMGYRGETIPEEKWAAANAKLDAAVEAQLKAELEGYKAAQEAAALAIKSAEGEADYTIKVQQNEIAAKFGVVKGEYGKAISRSMQAKVEPNSNTKLSVLAQNSKSAAKIDSEGQAIDLQRKAVELMAQHVRDRANRQRKGKRGAFGSPNKRQGLTAADPSNQIDLDESDEETVVPNRRDDEQDLEGFVESAYKTREQVLKDKRDIAWASGAGIMLD